MTYKRHIRTKTRRKSVKRNMKTKGMKNKSVKRKLHKYKAKGGVLNYLNQGLAHGKKLITDSTQQFKESRYGKKMANISNAVYDKRDRADAAKRTVDAVQKKIQSTTDKLNKKKLEVQQIQNELTKHREEHASSTMNYNTALTKLNPAPAPAPVPAPVPASKPLPVPKKPAFNRPQK